MESGSKVDTLYNLTEKNVYSVLRIDISTALIYQRSATLVVLQNKVCIKPFFLFCLEPYHENKQDIYRD